MMKNILFALAVITILYSCSSDSDKKTDESDQVSENSNGGEMPVDLVSEIDSLWNYYSGSIDDNSQLVMELSINGEDVNGSYWYIKHKKRIRVEGSIDTVLQEVILTEKVNGKITGHFKFRIDDDMLQGSWSIPNEKTGYGYRPLNFYSDLVYSVAKDHMKPEFHEYEMNHDIEVYHSEIDDFAIEEATDNCLITKITDDKFVYLYDVIGHNYHQGSIGGTGTFLTPKLGQFKDGEGCELLIKFYDSKIEIAEEQDCGMYKGARAFFGGTLLKKE